MLQCSKVELFLWKSLASELLAHLKLGPIDIHQGCQRFEQKMSNQIQEKKAVSSISKYMTVLILAILPVAFSLYANSGNVSGIIQTLTSGIFPVAFTALTWGLAVQQIMQIRKKWENNLLQKNDAYFLLFFFLIQNNSFVKKFYQKIY